MTVAIDVDDTVADLMGEWLRRYNEASGDCLLPEDVLSWSVSAQLKEGWKERFFDILLEPDLYPRILPLEGARTQVNRLKAAGHRVIFASSCPPGTEKHKVSWLMRYGFIDSITQFVSAKDKSLVRASYLIDDGPHNVTAFVGRAFLLSQPHNRSAICTLNKPRVPTLKAAVDIILSENFQLENQIPVHSGAQTAG